MTQHDDVAYLGHMLDRARDAVAALDGVTYGALSSELGRRAHPCVDERPAETPPMYLAEQLGGRLVSRSCGVLCRHSVPDPAGSCPVTVV